MFGHAVVLSLANDFLPQAQAIGSKQEPPQRATISRCRSKKKLTRFNLVANLTFRAFSGRTDITNSLQG